MDTRVAAQAVGSRVSGHFAQNDTQLSHRGFIVLFVAFLLLACAIAAFGQSVTIGVDRAAAPAPQVVVAGYGSLLGRYFDTFDPGDLFDAEQLFFVRAGVLTSHRPTARETFQPIQENATLPAGGSSDSSASTFTFPSASFDFATAATVPWSAASKEGPQQTTIADCSNNAAECPEPSTWVAASLAAVAFGWMKRRTILRRRS